MASEATGGRGHFGTHDQVLGGAGPGHRLAAGTADAKTLTFCASGSPEGFDPALHTAPATFDASSVPIYDRLVDFEKGSTKAVPGSRRTPGTSRADGLEYTFHLRTGVKFQTTAYFTPSRDLDADDVVFSFARQLKKDHPYFNYAGGNWPYFAAMSLPALIKSVERIDDATVKFTLTRAEAAFVADLGMDFASILSKEYADKLAAAGKTGEPRPAADRHRSVPVRRLRQGRHDPLQGQRRLLARQAGARRARLPDHARSGSAADEAANRASARSPIPCPADIAAIKADPKITVDQQELSTSAISPTTRSRSRSTTRGCARRSTWRSTSRRWSRRSCRDRDRGDESAAADRLVL